MGTAEQRETGVERSPVWGAIKAEVRCPLCGYELRGLVEPRCPECGYGYTWAEVLDPERQVHRYLFEHHPERNVRSFWRTAVGTWSPGTFWRELRPAQPSRGRRLVAYWIVTAAFVLAGVGAVLGLALLDTANRRGAERAAVVAAYSPGGPNAPVAAMMATRFGSVQKYVDVVFPAPSTVAFYLQQADVYRQAASYRVPLTTFALGAYVAWPWVTIAGLMVFQASMRRARVRPVHVVRCVLYSFDGGVWVGLGILIMVASIAWPVVHGTVPALDTVLDWAGWVPWVVALLLAVSVHRLRVAYRQYMRMELAWVVVLASQVMAALAAASVLFSWDAAVRKLLWVFG